MKNYNLHTILNSAILIGIITAGTFYFTSKKQSMAYIDNIQLFNSFNMTKDIKIIEEKKINDKAKLLDSIYRVLQLEKNQKGENAKKMIKEINDRRLELDEIRSNYQNNLTQNVWSRLNTYISEYSKEQQIDIVFGVNGNGNIMYAKNGIDITNAVLEFSNTKYEGN